LLASATPPISQSTLFPYTTLFRSAFLHFKIYILQRPHITIRCLAATVIHSTNFQIRILFSPNTVPEPVEVVRQRARAHQAQSVLDRKSTRLNSSHVKISYAVFYLK